MASTAEAASPLDDFKSNPTPKTAFDFLHQVAVHPRCANCHGIVVDGTHIPTAGDAREPHPMGVTAALNPRLTAQDGRFQLEPGRLGTDCLTCHRHDNTPSFGGPPGASNDEMPGFLWHMPPKKMAIPPGMSAHDLCEKWTNKVSNSSDAVPDRGDPTDLAKFRAAFLDHHAKTDPLVIWAWAPGKGRSAAPGTHEMFVAAMTKWIDGGAPCPPRR